MPKCEPMHQSSYLFRRMPHWSSTPYHLPQALSAAAQSWLYETGSLTQRLRRHYGARFGVRILRQYWHKPFVAESRLLGLASTRHALIREVVLHAEQQPLILARSIIPAATIAVAQRNLTQLGTRPLGEVIFAYPNLQRLNFAIAHLTPDVWQASCQQEFALTEAIYGRRTIYAIPTHPLLVTEIFLPPVLTLPLPASNLYNTSMFGN